MIVMDNVSYRSWRKEKLPTSAWRKSEIMEWFNGKQNLMTKHTKLREQLLTITQKEKDPIYEICSG